MTTTEQPLPPHPEEARLRKAERELATTLRQLVRKTCDALDSPTPQSRVESALLLQQLTEVAKNGALGMARAVQDQMDAAGRSES
jgi:hypothetical protein